MRGRIPVAMLLLIVSGAHAQSRPLRVGSFLPLEVLGWSAAERKVYVRDFGAVHALSESGRDSLACASEGGATSGCIGWFPGAEQQFTPLVSAPSDGPTFPVERVLVSDDSLSLGTRSFRRRVFDVRFERVGPRFRVTTFGHDEIALRACDSIPGTHLDLVVLAAHGLPGFGETWIATTVPRDADSTVTREIRHWLAP